MMLRFILVMFSFFSILNSVTFAAENDQAEVQWSICEASPEEFLNKFDESFEQKKNQTISFMETSDLYYLRQGVIFRIIKKQDGTVKSTVKIEIHHTNRVDWDWLEKQDHKCEINVYGQIEKLSCSMNNKVDDEDFFDKDQIDMVSRVAGLRFNKSDLAQLKKFGGLELKRWSSKSSELTFESVQVPGLGPVMELSIRVDSKMMASIQDQMNARIQKSGINLCPRQDGRTEIILEQLQKIKTSK